MIDQAEGVRASREVTMHIVDQSHPYWKTMDGFSRILFPTDFSESATHALESALDLVGVREVIVQHVVSTYFEKHPHWSTLFDIHEMQKYMEMYIETEMAKVPKAQEGINYRSVISEGKPAQQIVELAEKEKVDVIIMGPAKGVVTGLVIRASSRPVLAIPRSEHRQQPLGKISKILVATDLSAYSKTVVDYAFQLKRLFDCELYLLYVIELSNAIKFAIRQGSFTDAASRMRIWATNQLENLIPEPFAKDGSVHCLVEEGPVSDKIAECADLRDVNLVVLGAHGYGPVEKHFVGTNTDKVLTKLSRPVLIVKL
jgi:nucleotide-binding universal stress UspA family protein